MRRRVVDNAHVSEHLVDSVRNTMGEIQNLVLLALCWACTLSSSTLLTSIGPLTAEQLGAPESLAPLAVACFLFGAAIIYANESSTPGPFSRGIPSTEQQIADDPGTRELYKQIESTLDSVEGVNISSARQALQREYLVLPRHLHSFPVHVTVARQ